MYVVDPALVKLPAALKLTVAQAIAGAVDKEGIAAITRDDVKTVLDQQADLAMLGGDADGAALAALGQAVGAQYLVAAVVTSVGEAGADDNLVQLRLIESAKVSVIARRDLRTSENGGDLVKTVEDCTRLVLQPLFASGRGTIKLVVSEGGANILVDGKQLAVSQVPGGIVSLGVTSGYHLITVSKDSFVSFQETIQFKDGVTVERTAALAPSVDFLKEWRSKNGLYRGLAWTTTGITVLAAAAAGVSGFGLYDAIERTKRVAAEKEAQAVREGAAPGTVRFQELQAEITASANEQQPWAVATPTSATIAGVGLLLASYFWLFGDDPDRYVEFEKSAGLLAAE